MSKYTTYDEIWKEISNARKYLAQHGHKEVIDPERIERNIGRLNTIHTLGRCNRYGSVSKRFRLEFNYEYLRVCSDENAQSTIWHEVIHTCNNCFSHTGEWARMANLVNNTTLVKITRTNTDANYSKAQKQSHRHYNVYCRSCNRSCGTWYRYTDKLRQIERNSDRYFCAICKTRGTLSIVSDEFLKSKGIMPND